jgi:adenylylsulfate kinase-like enzyme
VLDGDELRRTMSADLGFSEEDRCEQSRRVARSALGVLEAGHLPIVALVCPLRRARAAAQAILGFAFLEVYVDAPVEVCAALDVKGMYAAARRGTLANFTGISSPYEPPQAPHLRLATANEGPVTSAERVVDLLVSRRALSRLSVSVPDGTTL